MPVADPLAPAPGLPTTGHPPQKTGRAPLSHEVRATEKSDARLKDSIHPKQAALQ